MIKLKDPVINIKNLTKTPILDINNYFGLIKNNHKKYYYDPDPATYYKKFYQEERYISLSSNIEEINIEDFFK